MSHDESEDDTPESAAVVVSNRGSCARSVVLLTDDEEATERIARIVISACGVDVGSGGITVGATNVASAIQVAVATASSAAFCEYTCGLRSPGSDDSGDESLCTGDEEKSCGEDCSVEESVGTEEAADTSSHIQRGEKCNRNEKMKLAESPGHSVETIVWARRLCALGLSGKLSPGSILALACLPAVMPHDDSLPYQAIHVISSRADPETTQQVAEILRQLFLAESIRVQGFMYSLARTHKLFTIDVLLIIVSLCLQLPVRAVKVPLADAVIDSFDQGAMPPLLLNSAFSLCKNWYNLEHGLVEFCTVLGQKTPSVPAVCVSLRMQTVAFLKLFLFSEFPHLREKVFHSTLQQCKLLSKPNQGPLHESSLECAIQLRWLLHANPADLRPFMSYLFSVLHPPALWPEWSYPIFFQCLLKLISPADRESTTTLFGVVNTYITSSVPKSQLIGLVLAGEFLKSGFSTHLVPESHMLISALCNLVLFTNVIDLATGALAVLKDLADFIAPVFVSYVYNTLFQANEKEFLALLQSSPFRLRSHDRVPVNPELSTNTDLMSCFVTYYLVLNQIDITDVLFDITEADRVLQSRNPSVLSQCFDVATAMSIATSPNSLSYAEISPRQVLDSAGDHYIGSNAEVHSSPVESIEQACPPDSNSLVPVHLGTVVNTSTALTVVHSEELVPQFFNKEELLFVNCLSQLAHLSRSDVEMNGKHRLTEELVGPSLRALPLISRHVDSNELGIIEQAIMSSAIHSLCLFSIDRAKDNSLFHAQHAITRAIAPPSVDTVVTPQVFMWMISRCEQIENEILKERKNLEISTVREKEQTLYNFLRTLSLAMDWCQAESSLLFRITKLVLKHSTKIFMLLSKLFEVERDPLVSSAVLDMLHKLCVFDGTLVPQVATLAKQALCRVYNAISHTPSLRSAPHACHTPHLFPHFPHYNSPPLSALHISHALTLVYTLHTPLECTSIAISIADAINSYDAHTNSWDQQLIPHSHAVFLTMDRHSIFLFFEITVHVVAGLGSGLTQGRHVVDPRAADWKVISSACDILHLLCSSSFARVNPRRRMFCIRCLWCVIQHAFILLRVKARSSAVAGQNGSDLHEYAGHFTKLATLLLEFMSNDAEQGKSKKKRAPKSKYDEALERFQDSKLAVRIKSLAQEIINIARGSKKVIPEVGEDTEALVGEGVGLTWLYDHNEEENEFCCISHL
ncbi:hypothetical protein Pelo_13575 [Pelomyxa schiedti]|nr:hypothetical protein Pelo_13575 [Pelomyxa schiedti]